MKLINGLILTIIIFFIIYILEMVVFLPAYLSYQTGCNNVPLSDGWSVSGTYNNGTICIFEEPDTLEYRRSLIHENCHKWQDDNGLSFNCEQPIRYYFNEVSCYFSEFAVIFG